mmetsp:Transcript_17323/g.69654  ORF Transcript_17323/g.69654 Transcript_17323/m.69654 type:complete len:217 (-) Transcript_17323:386-1036(-)
MSTRFSASSSHARSSELVNRPWHASTTPRVVADVLGGAASWRPVLPPNTVCTMAIDDDDDDDDFSLPPSKKNASSQSWRICVAASSDNAPPSASRAGSEIRSTCCVVPPTSAPTVTALPFPPRGVEVEKYSRPAAGADPAPISRCCDTTVPILCAPSAAAIATGMYSASDPDGHKTTSVPSGSSKAAARRSRMASVVSAYVLEPEVSSPKRRSAAS